MAYDVARQRVLLFGGLGNGSNSYSDSWEWDGSNWTQRTPTNSPSARGGHAMAYDFARECVLVFGGDDAFDDMWLYSSTPAIAQPFGTACSGSSTPPILTSNSPYLGNPAFGLDLLSARASAACLFGLSAARQSLPVGPCTLYLQNPIIPLPAVTNWAGFAESPRFALPLNINLRGVPLYAQAFVADPQGTALGLTFSAGLRLVLGD